jgi:hypothetical protein
VAAKTKTEPMTLGNMRQLRQEGARPAGISYAPNFR